VREHGRDRGRVDGFGPHAACGSRLVQPLAVAIDDDRRRLRLRVEQSRRERAAAEPEEAGEKK
jgi:hypothetical protein